MNVKPHSILMLLLLFCMCLFTACSRPGSAVKPAPGVPAGKACLYVSGSREMKSLLAVDGAALDGQPLYPGYLRRFHLEPGRHSLSLSAGGKVLASRDVNVAAGRRYVWNPEHSDQFVNIKYRYRTGTPPKPELVIVLAGQSEGGRLVKSSGPYSWLMPEKGASWRYTYAEREATTDVEDEFFPIDGECGPRDPLPQELYAPPEQRPVVVCCRKVLPIAASFFQLAAAAGGGEYNEQEEKRADTELAAQPLSDIPQAVDAMLRHGAGSKAAGLIRKRYGEMDPAKLSAAIRGICGQELEAEALELLQSDIRLTREYYYDEAKTPADRDRITGIIDQDVANAPGWWRVERDKALRSALDVAEKRMDADSLAALCMDMPGRDRPVFTDMMRGMMFPARMRLVRALRARDTAPMAEWYFELLSGPGGFCGEAFHDPVLGPQVLALPGVDRPGHRLYGDYIDFITGSCLTNRPADHFDRLTNLLAAVPHPGRIAGRLVAEYGSRGIKGHAGALGHEPTSEERKSIIFPSGPPLQGMADWYCWLLKNGDDSERMRAFIELYENDFADQLPVEKALRSAASGEKNEQYRTRMEQIFNGIDRPRARWPRKERKAGRSLPR